MCCVLHALSLLVQALLDSLQFFSIHLVRGWSKLDGVLQVWPHQDLV